MTGYELSRNWFDWCFENPELHSCTHTALYLWICERWNRVGQKEKFGLPTSDTMEVLGIKSKTTYHKVFADLVLWDFIKIVSESKNQNQARVISLCQKMVQQENGTRTALDTATIQQELQQQNSTSNGTVPIVKPINQQTNKQGNKKQEKTFSDEKPISRNAFADVWFSWFFEKNGNRYGEIKKTKDGTGEYEDMAKKDWVGVATIEKYCKQNFENLTESQKSKFQPIDTFKTILENYDLLPKFYQENTNPSFIASRISEIISMVKKAMSEQPLQTATSKPNPNGKKEKNDLVFANIINKFTEEENGKQIGHQESIAE